MGYRIEISAAARRQLDALPDAAYRRIKPKIDALSADPRPHGVKKLTGADRLYRIRAGDYRVVYQIRDAVLIVLVVRVAHRKDVYGP